MSKTTLHPWRLVLFTLLSLTDLFLTYQLLSRSDGWAYESNPVANWWLQRFSWLGLVGFKLGVMLLVQVLLVVVSFYRPRTGRRVLGFGCAVLFGVVCYSGFLLWRSEAHGYTSDPQVAGLVRQGRALDREIGRSKQFTAVRERVGAELLAGRCTMEEAVQALAATEKVKSSDWLAYLMMMYPGCSAAECLGANLVDCSLVPLQRKPAEHAALARRLAEAYQSWAGRPLPKCLPPGHWKRAPSESEGDFSLVQSAG